MKAKLIVTTAGIALILGFAPSLGGGNRSQVERPAYESECARLAHSCEVGTISWDALPGLWR